MIKDTGKWEKVLDSRSISLWNYW